MKDYTIIRELLRDKRGWNHSKLAAHEKTIQDILCVLAETPDEITLAGALLELKEKLQEEAKSIINKKKELDEREYRIERREWSVQRDVEDAINYREEAKEILKRIEQCETAEMRDRLKAAQFYKDAAERTVGFRTKESYTYIEGLSRILSGEAAQVQEKKEDEQ